MLRRKRDSFPSLPRQAANLAGEIGRSAVRVARGLPVSVDEKVAAARWSVCQGCPELIETRPDTFKCHECGCGMQAAVKWASKRCKLGKWAPDTLVSVLITTINDPYLAATIQNLEQTAHGRIEVLVAEDRKREGRRVMLNRLAQRARGELLFFVDSHCQMSDGWDGRLKEVCGPTDIVLGRIGAWRPQHTEPLGQAAYGLCRLDGGLIERWWGEADNEHRSEPVVESMGMTGCGFMMHASWFNGLGRYDEQLGPYGGDGPEWSLKTWLAGGRLLLVNEVTCWHVFETNKADALYPVDQRRLAHSAQRIRALTAAQAWPLQKLPIEWLFEKFATQDRKAPTVVHKRIERETVYHGGPGVLNSGSSPLESTRALVAPLAETRLREVMVTYE